MDIKQLRYFITIAEMGQITTAAKKLYIAQPALSHSMKLLEDELGVTLFDRLPTGIRLTAAGSLLLQSSYDILRRIDEIPVDMAKFRSGISGTVNIGMVSSSGGMLMNKSFMAFRNEYPEIKFNLYEGNSFQIIDYLNKGIIEIGVIRSPFDSTGFGHIASDPTPMVAVTHKDTWPFGNTDSIPVESLCDYPLIMNRRYYQILENVSKKDKLQFNFYCLNNDARTSFQWASSGIGIGIVPLEVAEIFAVPNIRYATIDHPDLYTQLCFIWLRRRPLSKISDTFLSYFGS
jgi:DNA-binding transcriptional LysR family regulator